MTLASPSRDRLPPEAWPRLVRWARHARQPIERFLEVEAASGILLMIAAVVALVWSGSPWAAGYHALWHQPIGVRAGAWRLEQPLHWWLNDGLMTLFFLVVGLELRRELHAGVLASWRRALLPAAAALGGMVVPALLYLALAGAPTTRHGWGVPMATDIAFALGVLTLLGRRVPPSLRVLLLALAVIDDLGAVLVIATCYAGSIVWSGIGLAVAGLLGVGLLQRLAVRARWPYVLPSLGIWAGLGTAGVHPSLAGVVIGLVTPVRAWWGADGLRQQLEQQLADWQTAVDDADLAERLRALDQARREARAPAEALIEALHPWVAFGVLPLFAFANAGVELSSREPTTSDWHAGLGVLVGLALGKPVGVVLAATVCIRAGVATLPEGLHLRHLLVLGLVAGVGFTMALFVAQLAFSEPDLLAAAKLGVLVASGLSAVLALAVGRLLLPAPALTPAVPPVTSSPPTA
jgi:NhaA family Na+:H+ antiporter